MQDMVNGVTVEDQGQAPENDAMVEKDRGRNAPDLPGPSSPDSQDSSVEEPVIRLSHSDVVDEVAKAAPAECNSRFIYGTNDRPLEGFTIKRGIGHGGFGEVYQAVNDAGKEVAIKLVRRNLDIELRGMRQCLNLKHPNLVNLFDIREDSKGNSWVVMDYVGGPCLEDEITKHPKGMPVDQVLGWFHGIAAGVQYLHDHGVVHRDMKPGNIFMDEGVVKVGDYGLSKFVSCSRRSGHTESIGTVHYMAPEVANGRYGKEIDVYALGVVLYEMLTGNVPFEGESVGEVLMKHLTARPDLSRLTEPYRTVVAGALEKDPTRRYPTAARMATALPQAMSDGSFARYAGPIPQQGNNAQAGAAPQGTVPPAILVGTVRDDSPPPLSPNGSNGRPGTGPNNTQSLFRHEPLMRGFLRAWDAWTKELRIVFIILTFLFIVIPIGLPVVAIAVVGYLCYFVVWCLVTEGKAGYQEASAGYRGPQGAGQRRPQNVGGGVRPQNSPFTPGARPVPARSAAPIRRVKKPTPDELTARYLRGKCFSKRVTELVGSMCAAMACALLTTVMLGAVRLIGPSPESLSIEQIASYAWLGLTSVVLSWAVLIPSKFWEGRTGESILRRFLLMVMGLGVGALAATLSFVLLADLPHSWNFPGPFLGHIFDRSPVGLLSLLTWSEIVYYLASFGLLGCVIRWWRLADPLRPRRFRFWPVFLVAAVGALVADIVGFPQPWLPLATGTAAIAIQLTAPWIAPEVRKTIHLDRMDVEA
jgi:serine/threonine protein kinase